MPNASVSAPIAWEELDDPGLRPDGWNIQSVLPRVEERGDLFHEALELEQELPALGVWGEEGWDLAPASSCDRLWCI